MPLRVLRRLVEPANLVTCSGAAAMLCGLIINCNNIAISPVLNAALLFYGYYVSDQFDGIVARKLNMTSRFGELLDLYCDRMGDCILSIILLVKYPHWWPFVSIFFIFKLAAEHILGRRLGLNDEDHKSDNNTSFSNVYTLMHVPIVLHSYMLTKAVFFIPNIIGLGIPYFEYFFAAFILFRSIFIVEIFTELANQKP